MTAIGDYAARVDAYDRQRAKIARPEGDRWASRAAFFRLDPKREMDANLAAVAELVASGDTVIDVGGGAGRVGLPLAVRCREVVNVEPSAAMREQFAQSAAEAGITNIRSIDAGWPQGGTGLRGDVVMTANVTYFVRDIEPFLRAMVESAARRVVIQVWSVPPPNHHAVLFERVHGEPQSLLPGHEALLPVLWEMGILPDVRLLPLPFWRTRQRPASREAAIDYALESIGTAATADTRGRVEAAFDDLFDTTPEGFAARWIPDVREMLITWETGR